ncbi:hypothetical protein DPMN_067560 [Dreissena polymorpha]|uniref:Uncharacterized protein n=1 Tax=Dreissena polymorpha TaxID=45954 RepID=A0A9D4BLF8_DREPO|nr:hypothetical protein DPMN_067560 [Dreissena polymorpha]
MQEHSRHKSLELRLNSSHKNVKKAFSNRNDYSFEHEFFYEILTNIVATTEASIHIAEKKLITEEIHEMYKSSCRSGQTANYLKYASLLVCIHDYEQAVEVLKYIESRITRDMVHLSMISDTKPMSFKISNNLTPLEMFKVFVSNIINYVEFTKHESNCAPSHLIYELHRTAGDDRAGYDGKRMFAVVDAKPFLYYLQNLAHTDDDGKNAAIEKLKCYCISAPEESPFRGRLETAYNLLGHILELENKAQEAWEVYIWSANLAPQKKAAYWHMCRLISDYVAADKALQKMGKYILPCTDSDTKWALSTNTTTVMH